MAAAYDGRVRRSEWWPDLADLCEQQGGMFTTAQAQQIGASRPQLQELSEEGVLDHVQRGVYQLAGTAVDQTTAVRAAWLALSPPRPRLTGCTGIPKRSCRTAAQRGC